MACNWFSSGRARQQAKAEAHPPPLPPEPTAVPGLVQVTSEEDGEIEPRQYSYWPCAYVQGASTFVLAGLKQTGRVHLFQVTGVQVVRMGPIGPAGTGEGWYWDAEGSIALTHGPQLIRLNPSSGSYSVLGDIGHNHPGCQLTQAHSSDDGRVHSATVVLQVESGPYPAIGTVVFTDGQEIFYTEARGNLDESHLSGNGRWLVIEENNDNRIILLPTGAEALLLNRDGALSHIDCGPDFMVGEDDQHEPGACVRWNLNWPLTPENRQLLYSSGVWGGQGMGHVSVQAGKCLLSTADELLDISLDRSRGPILVRAHGETGDKKLYNNQVKASLTRDGSAYCFMSNMGGSRQDVYLGRL